MNSINQTPIGYQNIKERKQSGSHYTPTSLSDFVAYEIVKSFVSDKNFNTLEILDPATGDGELLISLFKELTRNNYKNIKINGLDIDNNAVKVAIQRIEKECCAKEIIIKNDDFLEYVLNKKEGDLFKNTNNKYDLVIANPPYVRTQVMGAEKAQTLAKIFGLKGRVDLYFAFLKGISKIIKPGGIVGIIVSNRFMTTKSGEEVRKSILEDFDIISVWDLGDTKIFEAAVLPAVLLLKKKNSNSTAKTEPKLTTVYSTSNKQKTPLFVSNVIEALNEDGFVEIANKGTFIVEKGNLCISDGKSSIWRVSNNKSNDWLKIVNENTWKRFGEIGKIRVGIKTTADKVFIDRDWDKKTQEKIPELLKALITHHIARRFKCKSPVKQVLYPYLDSEKKSVVDLESYPNSKLYLESNRQVLESREYLVKSNREWYEIWVPQIPSLWKQPKIVFRDISEEPTFWMDLDGLIVNGDCYWLTTNNKEEVDLLWLALAVGNSTFIERFYDTKFNNKLYAGRRRFITQYVENFPIPDPNKKTSKLIIEKAKEIYKTLPNDTKEIEKELNNLILDAFGVLDKKL